MKNWRVIGGVIYTHNTDRTRTLDQIVQQYKTPGNMNFDPDFDEAAFRAGYLESIEDWRNAACVLQDAAQGPDNGD